MEKVDPEGWPTLGWDVIDWIETRLVHGPGDVQGEPITLDPELSRFVLRAYRVNPPDGHPRHVWGLRPGRRIFDEALLSRVKGRAKSELAGMLVCAEALGPVRFWRWHPDSGEPEGRPIRYPYVRCLATEEGQSSHTYLNAAYMLWVARDHFDDCANVDLGRDWQTSTRILLPGGGEIVPSTASSAAKDGGKETFSVFDETHLYVPVELRRMYATVKRNLTKRPQAEPWALQTSTMFAKGQGSTAEDTFKAGRGAAADPHLLVDHRGARKTGLRLVRSAELEAEVRYVYGAFADVIDLDRIVRALTDERDDEADRRRYFLGEPTDLSALFLPAGAWDVCGRTDRTVDDGAAVALGFDGSVRQDAAAIRLVTEDGHLFYPPRADGTGPAVWERPDHLGPGAAWEVPPDQVDATIDYICGRWTVVRGYCDPAWWGGWIATWRARHGDQTFVPWWTNRDAVMGRACRSVRTAIVQGELTHDGHPTAARHWRNAHRRLISSRDEEGRPLETFTKDRPGSPRKIDTAIADTLAWEARTDALAAGRFTLEPALPPPDIF